MQTVAKVTSCDSKQEIQPLICNQPHLDTEHQQTYAKHAFRQILATLIAAQRR